MRKIGSDDSVKLNVLQFRMQIATLDSTKVVPEFQKLIKDGDLLNPRSAYNELLRLGYKNELEQAGINADTFKKEDGKKEAITVAKDSSPAEITKDNNPEITTKKDEVSNVKDSKAVGKDNVK